MIGFQHSYLSSITKLRKTGFRHQMQLVYHDDVIDWEHSPRYWRLESTGHRWIPLTKASDAGL